MNKYALVEKSTGRVIQPGDLIVWRYTQGEEVELYLGIHGGQEGVPVSVYIDKLDRGEVDRVSLSNMHKLLQTQAYQIIELPTV